MPAQDSTVNAAHKRQIVLPYRVAVRMAYESIRMRLTRTLVAMGGIILGVAFLNSVMVTNLTLRGMRQWAAAEVSSPQFASLQQQRNELEQQLHGMRTGRPAGAADNTSNDEKMAADKLAQVRDELGAPATLQSLMAKDGVPVTETEIANDRIQTRWLLGLGLVVAFIGILNSMLMSVSERFREIGTMKCLGALDGFIIRLFLLESLFQGIVGTAAGILIGTTMSLVGQTISYGAFVWKNVLWTGLAESIGSCFLVGFVLTIAGAIYPAWQAARMQPIMAMRAHV